MRISFTKHALERMDERQVSKAEVEHVLKYGKVAPAQAGSQAKVAEVNGRPVKVTYVVEQDKTFNVTTVILPKKAK